MNAPAPKAEIEIPLDLVARTLEISVDDAIAAMRNGELTGVTEKGEGEDAGTWRLSFFHQGRRARIVIGPDGAVVRRSCIDFGRLSPRR